MKTAVVYSSKKGYVKEAVEKIKEGLGEQADLFDVLSRSPRDLASYDTIIFAASVRAGRFPGKFNKMCQKQVPLLEGQNLMLLVSGLDEKAYQVAVDRNLTAEVKDCFQKILYIGGRYIPEQNGPFIRMLMTKITRSEGSVLNEKMDVLGPLVEELQE